MATNICVLCQTPISETNDTWEHIIPNAVGGRRRIKGFICRPCNSETGNLWDAALADWLNAFCAFIGIKRHRGQVPSQVVPTLGGGQVTLHPDGSQSPVKPELSEKTEGNQISVHISARNDREARKMAGGILRKYPQLNATMDVEDLMAKVVHTQSYNNPPVQLLSQLDGREAERSMVKSTLALAYETGIDPSRCDNAIEFLRDDDAKPCWCTYFSPEFDLVVNRPDDTIFHCVAVHASNDSGKVLGFVEYFGLHRFIVLLSETYEGPQRESSYSIDPISGQELDLTVNFDLPANEIKTLPQNHIWDVDTVRGAIATPLRVAERRNFELARERAFETAFQHAMEACEKRPGDELTDDEAQELADAFVEHLMPFVSNNIRFFMSNT